VLGWSLLPSLAMRNYAKAAAMRCIRFYQATLSPDHGPLRHLFPYGFCKHDPTCSQYGSEQIARHGVVVGCCKATWRIIGCNPWSKPDRQRVRHAIDTNMKYYMETFPCSTIRRCTDVPPAGRMENIVSLRLQSRDKCWVSINQPVYDF